MLDLRKDVQSYGSKVVGVSEQSRGDVHRGRKLHLSHHAHRLLQTSRLRHVPDRGVGFHAQVRTIIDPTCGHGAQVAFDGVSQHAQILIAKAKRPNDVLRQRNVVAAKPREEHTVKHD